MPKKKIPCLETFLRFSVPNAALTAGNACASEWKWQRQTTSEGDSRQPTDDNRQPTDSRRKTDGRRAARENTERNGTERATVAAEAMGKWEKRSSINEVIVAAVSCCCCCAIRFAWAAHGAYACWAALRCVYARWTLTCGSKWTLRMLRAMRATRATHVQTRNVRKAKRKCPTSWRNSFSRAATRWIHPIDDWKAAKLQGNTATKREGEQQ